MDGQDDTPYVGRGKNNCQQVNQGLMKFKGRDGLPKSRIFRYLVPRQFISYRSLPPAPAGVHPYATWVEGIETCEGEVPLRGTVVAGYAVDGAPLLVGRATYAGQLLPACIDFNQRCAFVAWSAREHFTINFEALLVKRGTVEWIPCSGGLVPTGAFPVGLVHGMTAYAGRVLHRSNYIPGRVVYSERACYVTLNGYEVVFQKYEVLAILP